MPLRPLLPPLALLLLHALRPLALAPLLLTLALRLLFPVFWLPQRLFEFF